MSLETESGKKRIHAIDMARFYAMALVYYGHFVERFMLLKNPAGFLQYKWIYSFHMVVFFVLAGYVANEKDIQLSFGTYVKHRFFSRLLPFIFFTLLFMIPPLFLSGDFYQIQLPSVQGYIKGLVNTLFGIPTFCVPSWFILMLFSVELVHYAAFRFLKSNRKMLLGALGFFVAGYWLNLKLDIFNPIKGRVIGWNYLFIHEAITMYGFYLLGAYLRRRKFLVDRMPLKLSVPGAVITFLIVVFTYRLNTGPFNFTPYQAVVIIFASHGSFIWFPVTALAGSFLLLFLGKLTPPRKIILRLGQNTLLLMCLNGIFYHYINGPTANWVLDTFPGNGLTVFLSAIIVTLASLMLCIPLIYVFNRFVPQLVGKPKLNGPWLKNFI